MKPTCLWRFFRGNDGGKAISAAKQPTKKNEEKVYVTVIIKVIW